MATILEAIISEKKIEVEKLKSQFLDIQKQDICLSESNPYSLLTILKEAQNLSIIAEFKRASPSQGDINPTLNPVEQAGNYIKYGASAVSVLTDKRFFKGDFSDLIDVRRAIKAPILCKDFIIDSIQIDVAKQAGANIILLIVAALDEAKLKYLYHYAKNLNLDVLIEVHNEDELSLALNTGAKLIGVNNRNLKTFAVDLAVTERLAPIVKQSGAFLISESGIKNVEDVKRVVNAGANGILVGETFMSAENLSKTLQEMKLPLQKGVYK